jgi:hypothetical protein
MDLSKVMAISGKGGLFRIVSQSRGSVIVESLADGKKIPVFAKDRSSLLEDISMFTYDEDISLKKVLWAIYQKEDGKKVSIDLKNDNAPFREYFESVVPDYDKERVYNSDIKKVLTWYNILIGHNLITEPVEETEGEAEAKTDEPAAEEKPAKAEPKAKKGKKE